MSSGSHGQSPPLDAWHVTRTLRTMELLAVQPRSAPELADALGVHVRTARRVLRRLESEGYVTLTDDRRRRYATPCQGYVDGLVAVSTRALLQRN